MILEGIVTTTSADGTVNIAPMGPIVDEMPGRLVLRPFRTSTTFENLSNGCGGVFHVTDDVELVARAAIGALDPAPRLVSAASLSADLVSPRDQAASSSLTSLQVLADACRWYGFRIASIDNSQERTSIVADIAAAGRLRDFFGFNRGKHAVVEAAILATRTAFLPADEILADLSRLKVLVEKTGGAAEHRAFELLTEHIRAAVEMGRTEKAVARGRSR
jgi:hypothetical protein